MRIRISCDQLACEKGKGKKEGEHLGAKEFILSNLSRIVPYTIFALMSQFSTRHMPKFFMLSCLNFKSLSVFADFVTFYQ